MLKLVLSFIFSILFSVTALALEECGQVTQLTSLSAKSTSRMSIYSIKIATPRGITHLQSIDQELIELAKEAFGDKDLLLCWEKIENRTFYHLEERD